MSKITFVTEYDEVIGQIKTSMRSVGDDGSVLENACFTEGKLEAGASKDIGHAFAALLYWEEHKRGKS